MHVVIFCGGLGTRLREETEFRPKPRVPVGECPILWQYRHLPGATALQQPVEQRQGARESLGGLK
jgi:choline kinase